MSSLTLGDIALTLCAIAMWSFYVIWPWVTTVDSSWADTITAAAIRHEADITFRWCWPIACIMTFVISDLGVIGSLTFGTAAVTVMIIYGIYSALIKRRRARKLIAKQLAESQASLDEANKQ